MNKLRTSLPLFIGCFARRPKLLLASLVCLLSRGCVLADSDLTPVGTLLKRLIDIFPGSSPDDCDSAVIAAYASMVDVSQIKFYTWTIRYWSSSTGIVPRKLYQLEYGDEVRIKEALNHTEVLYLYVTFHGVGQDITAEWINKTIEGPRMSHVTIINVDYSNLVANNIQALRNVEAIANHTAVYLEWFVDSFLDGREMKPAGGGDLADILFGGFDMGAIIAGRTAEKLTEITNGKMKPSQLLALDPYLADPKDLANLPCYRFPELSRNAAEQVQVHYTSTCSHVPTIPTCDDSSNATMGHIDYFYNNAAVQPGCSASDVQCSKIRILDLYIEMVYREVQQPIIIAIKCNNFADFRNGLCTNCQFGSSCTYPVPFVTVLELGRYYIVTNAQTPYGRGTNFTAEYQN